MSDSKMLTPEELTMLSMKMMRTLTDELHHLNEQLTLNRDLMKEVRDVLVSNLNGTEEVGKMVVGLGDVLGSIDDVLDIHAAAMERLKEDTAGQSRITLSDYARAWWASAEDGGGDEEEEEG